MSDVLQRIARRIEAYAGLAPPSWVLAQRARERAAALGCDLRAYAELLDGDGPGHTGDGDGEELEALSEALRVGETRFFRHPNQLGLVKRHAIPERQRAGDGAKLRAWCAGCASGEEAWTLAVLLAEAGDFELLGTDLSEKALAVARAGWYPTERMIYVPPALRQRWFVRDGAGMRVVPPLRERVRYTRHNLALPLAPGVFDLVLCRNVLIYFKDARRDEAIARLEASLVPGGYLVLGNGETVRPGATQLEAVRDGDSLIYRRPLPSDAPRMPTPLTVLAVDPATSKPIVRLTGSYDDEERLSRELRAVIAGPARVVDLDAVDFLGDGAARVFSRLIESVPEVELRASRAPLRGWLERHGLAKHLAPGAASRSTPPAVATVRKSGTFRYPVLKRDATSGEERPKTGQHSPLVAPVPVAPTLKTSPAEVERQRRTTPFPPDVDATPQPGSLRVPTPGDDPDVTARVPRAPVDGDGEGGDPR